MFYIHLNKILILFTFKKFLIQVIDNIGLGALNIFHKMDDNFLSDNDFDSEEETYTVEYKKKVDLEPKSSPMNEEDDPNPNKNKISISKSEKKSGVVYLSSVPTSMNVKKLNEEFSKYGDLGRIYLKPEGKK